jgi:glycerophosphoryl diester phosphodiesterase
MNYKIKKSLEYIEKHEIGKLFHTKKEEILNNFSFELKKPIEVINVYFPWLNLWEYDDSNKVFEVLFNIDSEMNLTIIEMIEAEGVTTHLDIKLADVCEIKEIAEFYNDPDCEGLFEESVWTKLPLSKIITNAFLVVYEDDWESFKLLELKPELLDSIDSDLMRPLEIEYNPEIEDHDKFEKYMELEYGNWDNWLREKLTAKDIDKFLIDPTEDDFFYQENNLSPSSFRLSTILSYKPTFAFRISPMVSKMFIYDYFTYATESEGLLESIIFNWRHLPKVLNKEKIEIPTLYMHQIKNSIEIRSCKRYYQKVMRNLIEQKEPIRKVSHSYRKRSEYMALIHKLPI